MAETSSAKGVKKSDQDLLREAMEMGNKIKERQRANDLRIAMLSAKIAHSKIADAEAAKTAAEKKAADVSAELERLKAQTTVTKEIPRGNPQPVAGQGGIPQR